MSCRSPRTSSSPSRNRTVLVVNPHRATARKRAVTSSRAMAEYLRDSAASRQPTMIWGYQWNTWPKIFQLVSYLLRLFLHIDLCRAGHFSWSQFQSICTSGKINAIESTKLMHLFMVFLARLSFTMASHRKGVESSPELVCFYVKACVPVSQVWAGFWTRAQRSASGHTELVCPGEADSWEETRGSRAGEAVCQRPHEAISGAKLCQRRSF